MYTFLGTFLNFSLYIPGLPFYICKAQQQLFLVPSMLLSRFSRVRLCATPETAAHQAPHPWDSPGKNTGVGCHFHLNA